MSFPSPSVTPPDLSAWELNYDGFTFGGIVPGAPYQIQKATGLDLPALRTGDAARPRDQGEFAGLNLFGGRDIILDLIVIADDVSVDHAAQALLAALCTSSSGGFPVLAETPLYLQTPSRRLAVNARATKFNWPLDISRVLTDSFVASVAFHATDPRWYGTPTAATVIEPGASATITNTGTTEMRPILSITGICKEPIVTNNSLPGAPYLAYKDPAEAVGTPPNTVFQDGDIMTIDTDVHSSIYFNSVAGLTVAVPQWIVTGSTWWNLPPGDNDISFAVTSHDGDCTLTVAWAPAYLSA